MTQFQQPNGRGSPLTAPRCNLHFADQLDITAGAVPPAQLEFVIRIFNLGALEALPYHLLHAHWSRGVGGKIGKGDSKPWIGGWFYGQLKNNVYLYTAEDYVLKGIFLPVWTQPLSTASKNVSRH